MRKVNFLAAENGVFKTPNSIQANFAAKQTISKEKSVISEHSGTPNPHELHQAEE